MKLNGVTIPDDIVRRVVERRGTEHCFAELDPARTADIRQPNTASISTRDMGDTILRELEKAM